MTVCVECRSMVIYGMVHSLPVVDRQFCLLSLFTVDAVQNKCIVMPVRCTPCESMEWTENGVDERLGWLRENGMQRRNAQRGVCRRWMVRPSTVHNFIPTICPPILIQLTIAPSMSIIFFGVLFIPSFIQWGDKQKNIEK
jgi:hypothetical protein